MFPKSQTEGGIPLGRSLRIIKIRKYFVIFCNFPIDYLERLGYNLGMKDKPL